MVTAEGAERPDAVVVGAGAAGLSLACHLAAAGWPGRVIVIDDGAVPVDHAAWAYWSRGDQLLDRWATAGVDRLLVRSPGRELDLTLHAYRYRRMTGRRLAEATDHLLAAAPGITRVRGTVEQIDEGSDGARVTVLLAGTGERTVLTSRWVFDSVGLTGDRPTPPAARLEFHGEHVEWDDDRVDPSAVTLMDFRTSQSDGLAFVYVLPTSPRSALVERTRFVVGAGAPSPGTADADHVALYLGTALGSVDHRVVDVEHGTIPLHLRPPASPTAAVVPIGAHAGMVKASTGYGFERIQRHSAALAASLVRHGHPFDVASRHRRHTWLDAALLDVLHDEPAAMVDTFMGLFAGSPADDVLTFLDEDMSRTQEVRLIAAMPVLPFARLLIRRALRRRRA